MTIGAGCWHTLGLLGGMGPAATVDVLDKIVKATPAARDQEHIPILVRCIPQIPDRTAALLGRGPSPVDALIQGTAALRRAGAEVLAIACNTAHHWYQPIREAFGLPVVHIAEAVMYELRESDARGPVGIMATSGTILSGFYRQYLEAAGYVVLAPLPGSQVGEVDHAVDCAKAGDWNGARQSARYGADALFRRGAGQVVLACTELPLALAGLMPAGRLLDANQALARACVRAALCHDRDIPARVT
ncbi:MAG TPA: amino acid racemase [Rhodanobacter sp.]|nr:amino acid racemase [Rhodanobacter sp.]HXS04277.1 amino acid racemase [Rhodanobacter sp.]